MNLMIFVSQIPTYALSDQIGLDTETAYIWIWRQRKNIKLQ